MPYARLQYNGDNQYTTKDKRNLLLTQETIEKINNITTGGIDAVVETRSLAPYQTMTFAQLAALNDKEAIVEELNKAPINYFNSLIDEGVMWKRMGWSFISTDWETPRTIEGYFFVFNGYWVTESTK